MTVTTMSKAEFEAKYAWVTKTTNDLARSRRKFGTFWERVERQEAAQKIADEQGYLSAWREQTSIATNPINIARWEAEENAERQMIEDIRIATDKRLQEIKDQEITFNEQVNSGDFNETPITDVNLSGGCSECSEPEHQMPDGSLMKDSDMEKGNYMKIAGIAAAGVIGLLLYTRSVKK